MCCTHAHLLQVCLLAVLAVCCASPRPAAGPAKTINPSSDLKTDSSYGLGYGLGYGGGVGYGYPGPWGYGYPYRQGKLKRSAVF